MYPYPTDDGWVVSPKYRMMYFTSKGENTEHKSPINFNKPEGTTFQKNMLMMVFLNISPLWSTSFFWRLNQLEEDDDFGLLCLSSLSLLRDEEDGGVSSSCLFHNLSNSSANIVARFFSSNVHTSDCFRGCLQPLENKLNKYQGKEMVITKNPREKDCKIFQLT